MSNEPINLIEPVVKTFSCADHRENFRKGNIVLRSIQYFRSIEDQRNDKEDGRIISKNCSGGFSNTYAILCFHDLNIACSRYGEYGLKILNPDHLKEKIKDVLQPLLHSALLPSLKPINYYTKEDKLCVNHDEIPFCKSISHQIDKEKRIVFYLKSTKYLSDKDGAITIKWYKKRLYDPEKIGIQPHLCKLNKKENEITKEEWMDTKSENYGDDKYFEIWINNIDFESEMVSINKC